MGKHNKLITIALAVALVAVCFAGCAGSNPGSSSENPPASADNSAAPGAESSANESTAESTADSMGEVTEISWALWVAQSIDDSNDCATRLSEKMPNVEVQFIPLERATWVEQINTRVAGGDIPDIIYRESQTQVAEYARQSVITEVSIEKAKEFAPNIYEATKSYGKEVWLATNVSGKNYGLPIMQPNVIAPFSNSWRMDFLEKVGVTEIPTTLEEAESAFELIINNDVNSSGQNDTYGLTFRGKDSTDQLFASIFGAYGVLPAKWMIQEDGSLVYGIMTDQAKEALGKLNEWYEKGYIDPEFVTTDNAIFRQKLAGGNMAYVSFATWGRAQPPAGEFYLDVTGENPDARLEVGPPLKGPNGDSAFNKWGSITSSTTFGSHLAQDEDKLNLCLQVVDFVSANTDDAEYVRYGTEGTDWVRDPDTNAKIDQHADSADQAKFASKLLDCTPGIPALQERYYRSDDAEYSRYAKDGTVNPEEDYIEWAGLFTDPEIKSIENDIKPAYQKGFIDIIIGARPLDDFETIRQQWYDDGGTLVTDEFNRAYQEGKSEMDAIIAQIS